MSIKLNYVAVGDYYIPALELPKEERSIGRWGRLHREYLKETNPIFYNDLILTGKLWTYLADLNEHAQRRLECVIGQIQASEGISEALKEKDQMAWVRAMQSARSRAEEVVCAELIYN